MNIVNSSAQFLRTYRMCAGLMGMSIESVTIFARKVAPRSSPKFLGDLGLLGDLIMSCAGHSIPNHPSRSPP